MRNPRFFCCLNDEHKVQYKQYHHHVHNRMHFFVASFKYHGDWIENETNCDTSSDRESQYHH